VTIGFGMCAGTIRRAGDRRLTRIFDLNQGLSSPPFAVVVMTEQLTVGGTGDWFRRVSYRTSITDASAVVCVRGLYRTGRAGPL
jgi:hypothetical protein